MGQTLCIVALRSVRVLRLVEACSLLASAWYVQYGCQWVQLEKISCARIRLQACFAERTPAVDMSSWDACTGNKEHSQSLEEWR
jgi:hypothetical protein